VHNIAKTILRGERTEKATVTQKQNVHFIKRKMLSLQYCFYFFGIKTTKIMYYETTRTFFVYVIPKKCCTEKVLLFIW